MSILSEVAKPNGLLTKDDLRAFVKRSNYYVVNISRKNYESHYYKLIKGLHRFVTNSHNLHLGNNGLWMLDTCNQISHDSFCSLFEKAWGNRGNNFKIPMNANPHILDNAYHFIRSNPQKTLLCNEAINYIKAFIDNVFEGNDNKNPWKSLVYFSKFMSTFLPDLCVPVDTQSVQAIARDYRIKLLRSTGNISNYIDIHKKIRDHLICLIRRKFDSNIIDFKHIDDLRIIARENTEYFELDEVPLNRPIDKLYYSV